MESLLVFDNPDKSGHRASGAHPAMPNWPFRLLLAGPPGVGKRNLALNLIFRLSPPPTAVHVVHFDPTTREYDELETLGAPIYYYGLGDLPTIDNIAAPEGEDSDSQDDELICEEDKAPPIPIVSYLPGVTPETAPEPSPRSERAEKEKKPPQEPLVIFDEVTADTLPPSQATRMERLLNYGSTHRNCSVICSIQALTSLPPRSRRAFDHFCLWPQASGDANTLAASRSGLTADVLRELFGLCTDKHDSIWIDTSKGPEDPYRIRLNMLTPVVAESKIVL